MKITGSWSGFYQQTWPSEEEPLPLRIRLERSWWGAVRGTVYFGQEEEGDEGEPVTGWQHFRGLSFSVDITALNKQRAQAPSDATAAVSPHPPSSAAAASLQPPSSSTAATETPSHFWANKVVSVDELAGEWEYLVWMMVGPSRKKVQVGISEGSWSCQRTGLGR